MMEDQELLGQQFSNLEDKLKEIKNSDGVQKYSNLEKAIEGLANSQEYIKRLEQQLSEKELEKENALNELSKQKTVEELLLKVTQKEEVHAPQEPESYSVDTHSNEESLEDLVNRMLKNKDEEVIKSQNIKKVNDHLLSLYGDKASEMLSKKANELNTTIQDLSNLAEKSPNIVLNLFNAESKTNHKPTQTKVSTQINFGNTLELPKASKSLMRGAKASDVKDHVLKLKEHIYKKYNVE